MGDLATIIMSMDIPQLMGVGFGSMGIIGLVAYKALKKKPAPKTIDRPSVRKQIISVNEQSEKVGSEATYTVDTQAELSTMRPKITAASKVSQSAAQPKLEPSVNSEKTSSSELLESALVYDKYGSRNEAIEVLKEAVQNEDHQKEKIRLHVIYKNYITNKGSLAELVKKYPTFLKSETSGLEEDILSAYSSPEEKTAVKEEMPKIEDFPTFISDNGSMAQDQEIYKTEEDKLRELAAQAAEAEELQAKDDAEDSINFLQEFGDLARQIQQETAESSKTTFSEQASPTANQQEEQIFDVWANYMSMNEGRMALKNTFVHLDNAWGTVAGIAELQEKINQEIGKDPMGNQIPWAIVSVLPIKENR